MGNRLMPRIGQLVTRNYFGKWVLAGVLIGVVAGSGALLFYYLIQAVTINLLGGLTGFYLPNPAGEPAAPPTLSPHMLLIPISTTIGGLVAGGLIFRFAPEAEGHGTDAAIEAFHKKNGFIRKRVPLVKMLASAFTIGSGGSGGREGPSAQIGAGFGYFIADMLGMSAKDRRLAEAAGIGAGIGAIFKSPFGGAILSAEILYSGGDMEVEALVPAFISTLVGYLVFATFAGFGPLFGNGIQYTFTKPQNLLIYAALGLLCGLAGKLYTKTFYFFKQIFSSIRLPSYVKPAIGGGIVGLIGIFFPSVLGLGYGFVQYLINGNLDYFTSVNGPSLILILLAIALFKIIATSLSVGSGGSGGVFGPSLVIGGFLGAAVWVITSIALPGWITIPAPLVIVGMMSLFAGVGRTPIAVILMVSEMTGTLALLAPSMVAVVIAYIVTGSENTIYKSQVRTRADSEAHRGEYSIPLMQRIYVMDAMKNQVISLSPSDTVQNAYQTMLSKNFRGIPVTDTGKVVGMVTISDLLQVPRGDMATTKVGQVMTKNVVSVYPDETLLAAMDKMVNNGIGRLPVLSRSDGRLVGIVTRTDIMKAYDRVLGTISKSDAVEEARQD